MNSEAGKIVIFDDDEDILAFCNLFLSSKGWRVYTFTHCLDLLRTVSDIMPDIILMDHWLPGEGGVIATQKLKSTESLKHIPVIFFSAINDISRLAREAGADGILTKPFDLEALEFLLAQTKSYIDRSDLPGDTQ